MTTSTTSLPIAAILLAALVASCTPDEQVGANDPDATVTDGTPAIDASLDAALCACDASSCGARICGRSDCGFLCGECEPDEYCFVGNGCSTGVGPGTPCIDAFGDRVWEGDRGFRVCPTDPAAQQHCTCTGGGPDAWASCDAACLSICTHTPLTLTCGAPGCPPGDVCCIPTGATTDRTRTTGSCPAGHYTRSCDGPEDCSTGSCCGADFPWTASCSPTPDCGSLDELCHSTTDCPAAAPHCCPSSVVLDIRTCRATPSAGCT